MRYRRLSSQGNPELSSFASDQESKYTEYSDEILVGPPAHRSKAISPNCFTNNKGNIITSISLAPTSLSLSQTGFPTHIQRGEVSLISPQTYRHIFLPCISPEHSTPLKISHLKQPVPTIPIKTATPSEHMLWALITIRT